MTLVILGLLNAKILIALRPPAPIVTSDDLAGRIVGVISGTSEDFRVTVHGATVVVHDSVDEVLQSLQKGEVR